MKKTLKYRKRETATRQSCHFAYSAYSRTPHSAATFTLGSASWGRNSTLPLTTCVLHSDRSFPLL